MELAIHQTTSAGSDFRKSLEGYAKAGIRLVELIPGHYEPFAAKEGVPAARRLLADLGLRVVSAGGIRGLAEPGPERAQALEQLKPRSELAAALGADRLVCPSVTSAKYTADDFHRGAENLREAGDIAGRSGVAVMLEFTRGSTFAGSLSTALELVREAAHPHVKLVFDCYHFWASISKFEDLDLVRPGDIHHVHFQDATSGPRELLNQITREAPGEGAAPLIRILQKLKEKGYSGPLSVELFYPRFQKGDPFEVAAHIRQRGEAVMRQAGVL